MSMWKAAIALEGCQKADPFGGVAAVAAANSGLAALDPQVDAARSADCAANLTSPRVAKAINYCAV